MKQKRTLRSRLLEAREVLTGETKERGFLLWFQNEAENRTGTRPSPTTAHRWLKDPPERKMQPWAMVVAEELVTEARAKLRERRMDLR